MIATRSLKFSARPVRVSASSEESQGAGGEPPIASSSSTIPSSSSTPSSSSSSSSPPGAALAAAAATLGVVLFAVTRLSTGKHSERASRVIFWFEFRRIKKTRSEIETPNLNTKKKNSGGVTLADVAALSVPLDAAISSGRPTIIEFYADYCDVCKALAPDSAAVARKYGGGGGGGGSGASASTSASSSPSSARSLNFVLLNADNARWSPEVAEYGVRGVPHFVFLGADGAARGAAVGRLPPGELEADAADLVEGRPLSIGSRRGGSVGSAGASSPSPTSSSGLGEVTLLRGDRSGGENLPAPRAHG